MSKPKTRLEVTLSDQLRYGNKAQKEALLKWVTTDPRFKEGKRKPRPEELVEECLRVESPLYGMIETNRNKAAETYWRQAAQDIIRHINIVQIVIKTGEIITKPVKWYLHTEREQFGRIPEKNYVLTSRVADNPSLRFGALEMFRADFLAMLERYGRYAEFLNDPDVVGLVAAFRKLEAKMDEKVKTKAV